MNTELKLVAKIIKSDDKLAVNVEVLNSELEFRFGWGLKVTDHALANRLKKAVDAGAVFKDVHVAKDLYDKEYVTGTSRILSRLMNAELKRLGF